MYADGLGLGLGFGLGLDTNSISGHNNRHMKYLPNSKYSCLQLFKRK
jgi:hypothetical protein